MNINEKIRAFQRLEKVLREQEITNPEIQKKLGIKSQHWNNWRLRGIPANMIFIISDLLNLNAEWLAKGIGTPYVKKDDKNSDRCQRSSIPMISWALSKEDIENPEKWINCPIQHGPHAFAMVIQNNSMVSSIPAAKSYYPGDMIFVDPDGAVTNGCRVIVQLDVANDAIFREYDEEGGQMFLRPINTKFPLIEIFDKNSIKGVVIGQFRQD